MPSMSSPERTFLMAAMSPSSVPSLGTVTSSIPMASAMYGTTERFGVWKIHDARSSGRTVTRHVISWPICSARYMAKVESFPPEYIAANLMHRAYARTFIKIPCATPTLMSDIAQTVISVIGNL